MRVTNRSLVFLALFGLISVVGGSTSLYWDHCVGKSVAPETMNGSSGSGILAVAHAAELHQEKADQEDAKSAQGPHMDEATAKCLECHGPYESLVSKPGNFSITTYEGEKKYNPHRYAPHDTKDVPACANCHEVHPVAPESEVPKPDNVRWCYFACHHQQDFTPCSACHEWPSLP